MHSQTLYSIGMTPEAIADHFLRPQMSAALRSIVFTPLCKVNVNNRLIFRLDWCRCHFLMRHVLFNGNLFESLRLPFTLENGPPVVIGELPSFTIIAGLHTMTACFQFNIQSCPLTFKNRPVCSGSSPLTGHHWALCHHPCLQVLELAL